MNEKFLGGLAAITTLLVVGAIFGRLHGSGNDSVEANDDRVIQALGDRVISGLLALPLIALLVDAACPEAHVAWKLIAPAPLAVYTVLLAGTDTDWKWKLSVKYFTRTLIMSVGAIYVVAAIVAWFTAT